MLKYRCWHCIRSELFILHTTLRTITDVKRRYTKHCVNKMADSSRPGKFLTLLTLERSSFRENATLEATFFTKSICQDLNEPLNVPQTRKRPKKERTNYQTNKLTAEHYTPAAHARARGNNRCYGSMYAKKKVWQANNMHFLHRQLTLAI